MRGRHLEHAGTELEIHMLVADDGDELLFARKFGGQGTDDMFADELGITRVLGIHGHGGVAGNGLRPRRGNGQKRGCGAPAAGCGGDAFVAGRGGGFMRRGRRIYHFDFEIIERAFLLFHNYFLVGQRSERDGTPVHHPLAAIDEAFL